MLCRFECLSEMLYKNSAVCLVQHLCLIVQSVGIDKGDIPDLAKV